MISVAMLLVICPSRNSASMPWAIVTSRSPAAHAVAVTRRTRSSASERIMRGIEPPSPVDCAVEALILCPGEEGCQPTALFCCCNVKMSSRNCSVKRSSLNGDLHVEPETCRNLRWILLATEVLTDAVASTVGKSTRLRLARVREFTSATLVALAVALTISTPSLAQGRKGGTAEREQGKHRHFEADRDAHHNWQDPWEDWGRSWHGYRPHYRYYPYSRYYPHYGYSGQLTI